MIKKNTKIIFEEESGKGTELKGGIPLSVGEIINVDNKTSGEKTDFEVVDKKIEFVIKEDEQIADITYFLKKK